MRFVREKGQSCTYHLIDRVRFRSLFSSRPDLTAYSLQRCELCPSKDGAFKRTNNGNFAHVVCSLYIPEVQFGNVTTMEPIILSSIPADRFHKSCYICEERGKEGKAKIGACMPCNKTQCKQVFHVTCGQSEGLLCEQASSSDDSVKYCGYRKLHCQKKRKDPNIKFIPKFVPERRVERGDSSPEKKSHHNSDTSKPPKKKQKFYGTSNPVDSGQWPIARSCGRQVAN